MKKIGKAADVMDALDRVLQATFVDTQQLPGEYSIREIHERRLKIDPDATYDGTRNQIIRATRKGKWIVRKVGSFTYYKPKP
jgi:hypothetical protein